MTVVKYIKNILKLARNSIQVHCFTVMSILRMAALLTHSSFVQRRKPTKNHLSITEHSVIVRHFSEKYFYCRNAYCNFSEKMFSLMLRQSASAYFQQTSCCWRCPLEFHHTLNPISHAAQWQSFWGSIVLLYGFFPPTVSVFWILFFWLIPTKPQCALS